MKIFLFGTLFSIIAISAIFSYKVISKIENSSIVMENGEDFSLFK